MHIWIEKFQAIQRYTQHIQDEERKSKMINISKKKNFFIFILLCFFFFFVISFKTRFKRIPKNSKAHKCIITDTSYGLRSQIPLQFSIILHKTKNCRYWNQSQTIEISKNKCWRWANEKKRKKIRKKVKNKVGKYPKEEKEEEIK